MTIKAHLAELERQHKALEHEIADALAHSSTDELKIGELKRRKLILKLIARKEDDHWVVDALGAPHVGERSERDLIAAFVDKIATLKPQLVTFNGSFDLPVIRYRAMVHKVPAIGLSARPYFHRYTDDAIDLCDVLSSFAPGAKATLHELCRVMGLPGKPTGINGAEVAQFYRDGRIREIADYCESDVVNTYRVWLRHELFQGKLPDAAFESSEAQLEQFVRSRANAKSHLNV
jgi:predicted PolB exonuclease-like 3'-5' exonuclease